MDDTFTIDPPPAARIGAMTFCMPMYEPRKFTRQIFSRCSGRSCSIGRTQWMAALFTSTFNAPNAPAAMTALSQSVSLVTSR